MVAEAKRAANRLRDRWKKNPWLPGRTIDLGEHEADFWGSLHARSVKTDNLPPRHLDWLRWRYRRLRIDQSQADAWDELLHIELPRRLAALSEDAERFVPDCQSGFIFGVGSVSRKRAQRDRIRRKMIYDPAVVVAQPNALDAQAVSAIVIASATTLSPLLPLCRTQDERDQLVTALANYTLSPASPAFRQDWLEFIGWLKAR